MPLLTEWGAGMRSLLPGPPTHTSWFRPATTWNGYTAHARSKESERSGEGGGGGGGGRWGRRYPAGRGPVWIKLLQCYCKWTDRYSLWRPCQLSGEVPGTMEQFRWFLLRTARDPCVFSTFSCCLYANLKWSKRRGRGSRRSRRRRRSIKQS